MRFTRSELAAFYALRDAVLLIFLALANRGWVGTGALRRGSCALRLRHRRLRPHQNAANRIANGTTFHFNQVRFIGHLEFPEESSPARVPLV